MGWFDLEGQTQVLLSFYITTILSLNNGYKLRSSFLFQLLVSFMFYRFKIPKLHSWRVCFRAIVGLMDNLDGHGCYIYENLTAIRDKLTYVSRIKFSNKQKDCSTQCTRIFNVHNHHHWSIYHIVNPFCIHNKRECGEDSQLLLSIDITATPWDIINQFIIFETFMHS